MTEDQGDSREEEWLSLSVVGSPYEQEMEVRSGDMRHRLRKGPPIPPRQSFGHATMQQHPDDGWIAGPAPVNLGGFGG